MYLDIEIFNSSIRVLIRWHYVEIESFKYGITREETYNTTISNYTVVDRIKSSRIKVEIINLLLRRKRKEKEE